MRACEDVALSPHRGAAAGGWKDRLAALYFWLAIACDIQSPPIETPFHGKHAIAFCVMAKDAR